VALDNPADLSSVSGLCQRSKGKDQAVVLFHEVIGCLTKKLTGSLTHSFIASVPE